MRRTGPASLVGIVLVSALALPTLLVTDTPARPSDAQPAPPRETCPGAGDYRAEVGDEATVVAMLNRAVEASASTPHTGRLAMASFGEHGPQVTTVEVTRGIGTLRYTGGTDQAPRWEVGRTDGTGFLTSSSTLLRVGGVERVPSRLERLRAKYDVRQGPAVLVDTGPADVLLVYAPPNGSCRERLYVDHDTGLVVRRETFDLAGNPIRVVAYTSLVVEDRAAAVPAADRKTDSGGADDRATRGEADGFVTPEHLPEGYELQTVTALPDARVATVHLLYSDGLYTLSVFQQRGRLAARAVRGATEFRTESGGAAWRIPGPEPRQMVWTGEGTTFTALSDAPTDELLRVIDGLPTDPPPSILDRLARGLTRVSRWFLPSDRSDT